jgi:hypothetical protein
VSIVSKKPKKETKKINLQIEKEVDNDLMLYLQMLCDNDKGRVVSELLKFALSKDADFKEFKSKLTTEGKEDCN